VDDQIRRRERTEASQVRASLAAHMDPVRRQELVELERRVETIRGNVRRQGRESDALLEDFIGLDRLLGSFVRLAVMHRATCESLSMTDRDALVLQAQTLERERDAAPSQQLRAAITRQLALVRRRLVCFDRNRQRLAAMDHQLSTVAEMVRLVHEQSLTLLDASRAAEMVDHVLAELEEHEQALDELVSVCLPDDDALFVEDEVRATLPRTQIRVAAL
jgi:hypothetical protein